LSGFTGTLQADAYAGYGGVYEGGRVKEPVCMAHVRRPFYDLYETHKSAVAKEALERIKALYAIEGEIRGRSLGNVVRFGLSEASPYWNR